MAERCQHMNFAATVNVARLEDSGRFMAGIRVRCAECGLPFQFLGLEPGIDPRDARVSVDGLEANIGICPQGAEPSPLDNIMINIGAGGKRHG